MKSSKIIVLSLLFACGSVLSQIGFANDFYGDPKTGYVEIEDRYGASFYIPTDYTPEKDWPFVIVLFSDESEKGVQFRDAWLAELKKENVIGLFISYLEMREAPFASDERVLKRIREISRIYKIDSSKVLLTAFGEAAHYAFYLGFSYPEYFSAVGVAGGGAEGRFQTFFRYGHQDAKKIHFYVAYGSNDTTINKESFAASHSKLHMRGYQIEIEEFQGLTHKMHPEFRTKILDWFKQLPVEQAAVAEENADAEGSAAAQISKAPTYITGLIRGIFKG